jgi:hypothetical protein
MGLKFGLMGSVFIALNAFQINKFQKSEVNTKNTATFTKSAKFKKST